MRRVLCPSAFLLPLLIALVPSACQGGNVLVLPTEGSHWINMDILLQALHLRGHTITILRSSKSWYIQEKSNYYKSFTVQVERTLDEKFITDLISKSIEFERGALATTSFLNMMFGMFSVFVEAHTAVGDYVKAILDDQDLMNTLRESQFDLVLTDPCWGGGVILAKYLDLPLVYNVRWLLGFEAHLAIAPSPISYIPITGSGNTDKMTFFERVKNVALHVVSQTQNYLVAKQVYQPICDKYLGPGYDYYQLMTEADIWLMRADFVFEFPRPTMPNVVYMGGFQCKPAQPLPADLEEFVQSSGEHGVIVMSLGTFVSQLPADITDEVAAAFARLPQKVVWRHKGQRPSNLGANTLIVDWMPQNDLLGHPKTKLFVAHGGTNGVQEALYHGVPVVGLPIFFDQYDNLLRLKVRGGAELLSLSTVDKEDNFLKAVQKVLSDPSYRVNMQRLSSLHRDQPMAPMDTALFWIEFVMRHRGAPHLRTEANKLPWYIYHSVDVMASVAAAAAVVSLLPLMLCRCVCRKTSSAGKFKSQ